MQPHASGLAPAPAARRAASVRQPAGPNMVKVLPLPVWPYAASVQSTPARNRSTSGAATTAYARAWSLPVSSGPAAAAGQSAPATSSPPPAEARTASAPSSPCSGRTLVATVTRSCWPMAGGGRRSCGGGLPPPPSRGEGPGNFSASRAAAWRATSSVCTGGGAIPLSTHGVL